MQSGLDSALKLSVPQTAEVPVRRGFSQKYACAGLVRDSPCDGRRRCRPPPRLSLVWFGGESAVASSGRFGTPQFSHTTIKAVVDPMGLSETPSALHRAPQDQKPTRNRRFAYAFALSISLQRARREMRFPMF